LHDTFITDLAPAENALMCGYPPPSRTSQPKGPEATLFFSSSQLRSSHPLPPQCGAGYPLSSSISATRNKKTATIGFKLNWEKLLASKGLEIHWHSLRQRAALPGPSTINPQLSTSLRPERHKTALTRYELSKPVKSLLEYGVLEPGRTFFDYGCGQGSDVRGLQALGYPPRSLPGPQLLCRGISRTTAGDSLSPPGRPVSHTAIC